MTASSKPTPAQTHSRFYTNILWSWAGQLIFVCGGFLLPRAIDESLGNIRLGIWDFAWAIVAYLNLIEAGVSSSVNRYVALHLAEDDTAGLKRTIASVMCLQGSMGLLLLTTTVGVCLSLPLLWSTRLGDLLPEAQA